MMHHLLWFVKKIGYKHLFPTIILLLLSLFTLLSINGSSIGYLHQFLYDKGDDSSLLANEPRGIRSDEWLTNTPLVVGQVNNDFKTINDNIGNGHDMSVILNVPYKDWSTAFRLENLGFFVLPAQNAFALKWWTPAALVILSVYYFVLLIRPKKYVLAVAIGLGVFFTPYLQWWYQSLSALPIAYTFILLTLFTLLLRDAKRAKLNYKRILAYAITIGYSLFAFAIVMYPPWQITCALVGLAVAIGLLLESKPSTTILKRLATVLALALSIAVVLVAAFFADHRTAIESTLHTVYPGNRFVENGGLDLQHFFTGFHNYQLQSDTKAQYYSSNQSEAANYLQLLPFMTIPLLFVAFKNYRAKKYDWNLLLILVLSIIFMFNCFVPMPDFFAKITLLNRVPHERVLMGLGLLSFMFVVFLDKKYQDHPQFRFPKIIPISSALFIGATSFYYLLTTHRLYPYYLGSHTKIVLTSLTVMAIVYLALSRKTTLAALLILSFGLYSSALIHPLYRGFSELQDPKISNLFKLDNDSGKKWVVNDIYALNSLPVAYGKKSLTGIYTYPQSELWSPLTKDDNIYNRYAHAFARKTPDGKPISALQRDAFIIDFRPCSDYFRNQHVGYILSSKRLTDSCVRKLGEQPFPTTTLYVYEIIAPDR